MAKVLHEVYPEEAARHMPMQEMLPEDWHFVYEAVGSWIYNRIEESPPELDLPGATSVIVELDDGRTMGYSCLIAPANSVEVIN